MTHDEVRTWLGRAGFAVPAYAGTGTHVAGRGQTLFRWRVAGGFAGDFERSETAGETWAGLLPYSPLSLLYYATRRSGCFGTLDAECWLYAWEETVRPAVQVSQGPAPAYRFLGRWEDAECFRMAEHALTGGMPLGVFLDWLRDERGLQC